MVEGVLLSESRMMSSGIDLAEENAIHNNNNDIHYDTHYENNGNNVHHNNSANNNNNDEERDNEARLADEIVEREVEEKTAEERRVSGTDRNQDAAVISGDGGAIDLHGADSHGAETNEADLPGSVKTSTSGDATATDGPSPRSSVAGRTQSAESPTTGTTRFQASSSLNSRTSFVDEPSA